MTDLETNLAPPSPLSRLLSDALAATVSTEQALAGRKALPAVLAHAANVAKLDAFIRQERLPVKLTYRFAGLDYQLARHAVWVAETVNTHRTQWPGIEQLGPSKILLVREAERRFAREGQPLDFVSLLEALESGVPRSEVRRRFLPSAPKDPVMAVLSHMHAGRVEQARRTLAGLSAHDTAALVATLESTMALMERTGGRTTSASTPTRDAEPSSITDALLRLAGGGDE